MKKMVSLVLLSLMLVISACGAKTATTEQKDAASTAAPTAAAKTDAKAGGKVGISMPTKSSERWVSDGANMVKEFEELGYKTDLQYAEDVIENQVAQIENMITKGVNILVIAPIDGESLTDVLKKAHDARLRLSLTTV